MTSTAAIVELIDARIAELGKEVDRLRRALELLGEFADVETAAGLPPYHYPARVVGS